jgi:uncharacterized protein YkwD
MTCSRLATLPLALAFSLAALPVLSAQAPKPAPAAKKAEATLDEVESGIFEQINQLRKQHGAPPLKKNEKLMKLAREYSERMAKERFFGHVDPQGRTFADRLSTTGLIFRQLGENIVKHSDPGEPVAYAIKAWMNSKHHRETLLTPGFEETGIGVWREGKSYHYTQVFFTGEVARILP